MSVRPAAIGRVPGHGHPLREGAPANLALYDPAVTATPVNPAVHASKSRNSPFKGMPLPGAVLATFLRGSATVLDGKVTR